ncbi:DUF333 domain-containing protein [Bdellovibrio sp. HCB290]|uniref:DUF333 domain-containing protein n=1 Tax=Bdellovibrio sp. HCB290 TaxID=3394356 RepID=UPI0039B5A21E
MKKVFSILVCSVLIGFQAPAAGPIVIAGTGNPASALCVKLYGVEVAVQDKQGQSTLCAFGAALIEEWTLMSAYRKPTPPQAVEALLGSATPNCKKLGGKVVSVQERRSGTAIPLCEFPDGSLIGLETLKKGVNAGENQQLINLLVK